MTSTRPQTLPESRSPATSRETSAVRSPEAAAPAAATRGGAIAVNVRHTVCRQGGKPRARCSNGTTFMIRLLPKDQTAAFELSRECPLYDTMHRPSSSPRRMRNCIAKAKASHSYERLRQLLRAAEGIRRRI